MKEQVAERKRKGMAGGLYRKWYAREGCFMWLGRVIIGGHKHRTKSYLTKSEAKQALDQLKVDVRQRKRTVDRILFLQFADEFLEHARLLNRNYESHVARLTHLKPFFKGKKLDEITKADIHRYINGRLKAGRMTGTVNRELACLKRLLNYAVEIEKLAVNPMTRMPLLKEAQRPVKSLTPEEERQLVDFCKRSGHPTYQVFADMIVVTIHTGMRLSEILELKWEQVDLKSGIITLGKTKAKKVRLLPINAVVNEVLLRLNEFSCNEYVFSIDRSGSAEDMKDRIKYHWREMRKKAGIRVRFHDLRATFATRLDRKGTSPFTIKDLLGHSTLAVTQRYISVDDSARRAVDQLATGHEIGHDSETAIERKPQIM